MKKIITICLLLTCHIYCFGQHPLIKNPSVPLPPMLSREQLLSREQSEFYPQSMGGVRNKPTGARQRMIASSNTSYYQGVSLMDSMRFSYSGNRGSSPTNKINNVTIDDISSSSFDTAFSVVLSPLSAYYNYFPYISASYDEKDRLSRYGQYDTSRTLGIEYRYTYFANDSLESIVIRYLGVPSNTFATRTTLYNSNGMIIKDSMMHLSINTTSANDSVYDVMNVHFDSLNRVDYIDSISFTNTTWGGFYCLRQTIKNAYNSSASIFPDGDSSSRIIYNIANVGIDTFGVIHNEYQYNSLGELTQVTHYWNVMSSLQPGWTPLTREIYTYNNDKQISSFLSQQYSNSFVNADKRDFEYVHKINTVLTAYTTNTGTNWYETLKVISVLDENDLIDSVKTYEGGVYYDLVTYPTNDYQNRTAANYFNVYNNQPIIRGALRYYYDEYDDPTSITITKNNIAQLSL